MYKLIVDGKLYYWETDMRGGYQASEPCFGITVKDEYEEEVYSSYPKVFPTISQELVKSIITCKHEKLTRINTGQVMMQMCNLCGEHFNRMPYDPVYEAILVIREEEERE